MNCLTDYIGLRGCSSSIPPSGLYVNDLPGISLKQIVSLTNEEEKTYLELWEMIQYSCTKSHLEVFKIARDNNFDTIFVAEDDFDIIEKLYSPYESPITFKEKISLIKNDLDNVDWDIFLFGCNPKTHIVPVTENVGIVYKSTGAWAYLIKRRAYEYLIDNLNYKRDYIIISKL